MTITPELLKMIGYCLAPLDEERAKILRGFKGPVDWDELCQFCEKRGILNLVYAMLKRAGIEDRIPAEVREKMSQYYKNLAVHNELKLKSAVPVSAHLAQNGVDLLFFKGASMLLAGDYRDFGERIASDVDVIIHEEHRAEASRLLGELEQWSNANPEDTHPVAEAKWYNPWGVLIEVHSRLHDLNGVPAQRAMDRLWRHAEQVSYDNQTVLITSREDRFIQSAVHFTAHHAFELSFMLVCIADLAHLAGKEGKAMDWEEIYNNLQNERMLEHVMVVMEAADELLDYGPIKQGLEYINSRAPELLKITRPLARSLVKTIKKPKLFRGRSVMYICSRRIPWLIRMRSFIGPSAKRLINKFRKSDRKLQVIPSEGKYGNIWTNPNGWDFFYELSRFYRKTGYYGHCARHRALATEERDLT